MHLCFRVTDTVILPVRSYTWLGRLKTVASTVLTWITFVMFIQRAGSLRNKLTRDYDIIQGLIGILMLLFLAITYENNRQPTLGAKKELSLRVIEQFSYWFCVYFNEHIDQKRILRSQHFFRKIRSLVDPVKVDLKNMINGLLVSKCTIALIISGNSA